jgi:nitrite reductase (NADH) large subunit
MPGGEVTPDGLIAVGQVAKKYGLYTKITGGRGSTCSARAWSSCR